MRPTRRELLQTTALLGVAGAAMAAGAGTGESGTTGPAHAAGEGLAALPTVKQGDMLYRMLGQTGEQVSIVGLGGHHIGRPPDEADGIRIIRHAIDHGITFMDNCWDYHAGGSEQRMGKALRDGYRPKVFLMTKIDGRTREAAARQIDESLRRLQTDHVDLIQHHEIIRLEDPDRVFAPGGAQEAMLEARQAGKIRFIGFTGHKDPLVHLRMLATAREHGFHFDAVQMPLNVMDSHFRSFEQQVVPVLVRERVGILGMKSMGDGFILGSGVVSPIECLHYALSLPTSVVITGMEQIDRVDQALQAVQAFTPLSAQQMAALRGRTETAAAGGRYELFKTSARFDGTAQHPDWLG
jgi:aryl-alcohol dehydrogenase-like predicted oxidoreductase